MLLPCETILGEPEGFHLKKEKQKKPQQETASHKFSNNISDKGSSEDEFQGLKHIHSIRVRTREEHRVKDRERILTPPHHEDIKFTIKVTNNAAAARKM